MLRRPFNRLIHAVRRAVIEAGAITPGTCLADSFGAFGTASYIGFPMVSLFGQRAIHVGSGTLIGAQCTLSVGHAPDDAELPEVGLRIGDRCVIGARSMLTAHESIVVGDDVWFGQDVFVSDSGHGYQDPETPIGLQLVNADPVRIGSGSWIGHGAIVLPGARVGRNVVVAAGSVVRGVIPDHSVVAGVPARVVRSLEPGVGWIPTSGSGEIRWAWTSDEVRRMLAGEDVIPASQSGRKP